jgi:hypothetical protein
MNVALSRTFAIHEKQSLQIRGEAFNLPNTVNLANPAAGSLSRTSGVFGVIQSDVNASSANTGDYRVIQLAAKYVF